MIDDAALPHEGCLDKNYVNGYSWQYAPDTAYFNPSPPAGDGALTGWFAITTDASPTCTTQTPVANVRVEVRQYRTYALANDARQLLQDQASGGLGSGLFFPNYQPGWGNPDVRNERDGGESWLPAPSGFWHGWPSSRAAVPAGTTAVCSSTRRVSCSTTRRGPTTARQHACSPRRDSTGGSRQRPEATTWA